MSRLVLATGGTGGHIYPALAVAAAATRRGHECHLLGDDGGMTGALAEEAGVTFHGVRSGKLDRQRPDPRALWRSVEGVGDALRVIRSLRPSLVMGFGGFASFPGCAAALLTRVPLVLHEQNAYPGLVTRVLGSLAQVVVLSQPAAREHLRVRRTVELPYPVRETRFDRNAARRALGLPEAGTLTLVMGGSQGSAALNGAVIDALKELRDLRPLVLHSTGPAHLEGVRRSAAGISNYFARPYVDAALAWSAADLAITRAGVGTLSEAAFHGVPLIMVPLPTAAEDHQRHNAQAFASGGAGLVVEQERLAELSGTWRTLLDEQRREAAARAAAARSPAGAAERFANLIDELLASERRAPEVQETR